MDLFQGPDLLGDRFPNKRIADPCLLRSMEFSSTPRSGGPEGMNAMSEGKNQQLPLLPLRDLIIFPHMMMPLFVGREKEYQCS